MDIITYVKCERIIEEKVIFYFKTVVGYSPGKTEENNHRAEVCWCTVCDPNGVSLEKKTTATLTHSVLSEDTIKTSLTETAFCGVNCFQLQTVSASEMWVNSYQNIWRNKSFFIYSAVRT